MNLSWLLFAVALLVGASITVQTGSLKEAFGEALPAVIVSSSLGVILLVAVMLGARTSWPSPSSLAGAPWVELAGRRARRRLRGRHRALGAGPRGGDAYGACRHRSTRLLCRA